MNRIETKEELIAWATAVNQGLTLKEKCDYQDIWAHSNPETIKRLFLDCNGERSLIVHSVFNTMSYDAVEDLLKTWAVAKANKVVEEEIERHYKDINKRDGEVFKRELSLKDCLKGYWKRMSDIKTKVNALTRRNNYLTQANEELRKELSQLRHANFTLADKAEKYDAIKAALMP